MAKRELPEINASSLADIAFLLLTFFLVATTLNKPIGVYEKLPDLEKVKLDTKELESVPRNILTITIDNNDVVKVRDKVVNLSNIKQMVIDHVDNNGKGKCDYCKGEKNPLFSDSPDKAIILLQRGNLSTYKSKYSAVASVESAYKTLRERYTQDKYNRTYKSIRDYHKKAINIKEPVRELLDIYTEVEKKYPFNFSKPDPEENL